MRVRCGEYRHYTSQFLGLISLKVENEKKKKKKNVPVTLSAVQQVKTENQPSSLLKKSIKLDQPLHKADQSDVSEPPKRKGWSSQTNFLSKPEGRISTFIAFWKAGTMTNSPFFPYSFTLSSSMELMI